MIPNRSSQSPAPQWETLQDQGTTDSSEVDDWRNVVPPHRMAPKPPLKRKESDRPTQTSSVKRPRVEPESTTAGPSRPQASRETDSPDAAAGLLQYAKSIPVANKPRSEKKPSISAPAPPRTQPPPRPRPRPSLVVPNSMKSASHAPPPADAEIIDISSGDEVPPRPPKPRRKEGITLQKMKDKKMFMTLASAKNLKKRPESASAPVKAAKKASPEVIEILDSDEEEEMRQRTQTAGASTSAGGSAKPAATRPQKSDASMASGTDVPPTNAKGKGKARAIPSDDDSDASMAYAPVSRSSSRAASDSRPKTPEPPAQAPLKPEPLTPMRPPAFVSRPAPAATPTRPATSTSLAGATHRSTAKSTAPFSSISALASAFPSASISATISTTPKPKPTASSSTATHAPAPPPPAPVSPESPALRYTPQKPTSAAAPAPIRAGPGAGPGAIRSPNTHTQQPGQQEPPKKPKRRQVAVKSTTSSRLHASIPTARKTTSSHRPVPSRLPIASDSDEEDDSSSSSSPEEEGASSRSTSQSGSRTRARPGPPTLFRPPPPRVGGRTAVVGSGSASGSQRVVSDSSARSVQMTSDIEPDTRGLSDALGLSRNRGNQIASQTDSETSGRDNARDKGKGKEKETIVMRAPLPGRQSQTHSRNTSASSSVLQAAIKDARPSYQVPKTNPVPTTSAFAAPRLPAPPPPVAAASTAASAPVRAQSSVENLRRPKPRKVAVPDDSDEAIPNESEGLSSDAGYETVLRGSQSIVNKLAQLRREKSAASLPISGVSGTQSVVPTIPAKIPPTRVVSPVEVNLPPASPPPISPTPPLSTPAEMSPSFNAVIPRPLIAEGRTQSAPSLGSVDATVVTRKQTPPVRQTSSLSQAGRPEGQKAPLPNRHQRPSSISSIPQSLQTPTTPTQTQQRGLGPSSAIQIRSPGTKPIWPPPPPSEPDMDFEPERPLDEEMLQEQEVRAPSVDVRMASDGETDAAPVATDEASEIGGGVDLLDENPPVEQSEEEDLWEIEQVQQEVAEMSQSLAAASLSGPTSDLDEEIPEYDREEGPSRRTTRSSSASSGVHDRILATPSSDDNTNALVETGSNGHADSGEDLTGKAPRAPTKTYGGFPVLTWKDYRKDLRNFAPECLYAADIPRALHDHVNRLAVYVRLLPGMRAVYQAMIQENTAADEPDAPPVRIENPVDEEPTPAWEFYYTNKIYHGPNVPPPDVKKLVSCGCRGRCNPKSSSCACVIRQREAYDNQQKMNFAYDKYGHLIHPGYPIYECNDLCGCGDECMNRVVQHGRKVGVAIRKTPNKGWGIFATQKIASGQFIGIYSGELLTDYEAHERGVKYNKWGKTYLFDLDFHHLRILDKNWTNQFTVDAYHCGNFTRFLNHSCDPNSRLYPCYINEGNIQKPLLAIFSRRVIEADEEICFNYQGNYPGDDEEETEEPITEREAQDRDLIYEQCMCGAANCTGVMFK